MNGANRERVKELLSRAARLSPADRVAYIRQASGADELSAAEAIDLLATLDDDRFMSAPTGAGLTAALPEAGIPGESAGAVIGRYKLLQLIGEGGFGSVFMAEQTSPVQRRVALKIIKAGMDTKQVIARFEAERQALAMMDHPNIARVLDAGATDRGRPFFVMELVRGEPLTRYCDQERLSIGKRLELFQNVCYAVQHAHQKGIIHRDLKPSNILVTVADGAPVPKVIDFGIAKATGVRLTDKTLFTELHQLIGTPEYMSPEQAEVAGVDVDTRSDVYSLGVLLYELLAGSTPLERAGLRTTPMAEIQRLIREEEPLPPSLRLATRASSGSNSGSSSETTDSSAMEIAWRRRTEPLPLGRELRGDLDWIALKCLEKDRSRRYATANALAEDVGRYLSDQPVEAMPPGAVYRLRKFARRNRVAVLAGSAIAVTLLIATAVSVAFALNATRHRRSAESALVRAELAEHAASARADELEQVARFQQAQLADIDVEAMGADLRSKLLARVQAAGADSDSASQDIGAQGSGFEQILAGTDFTGLALEILTGHFFEPALAAIKKEFATQPLLEARLLQTSAGTLYDLGLSDAAVTPQKEALAIRRRELGDDHPDTIHSIRSMGFVLKEQGKLAEAEPIVREAVERGRRVLGEDHPETLAAINYMSLLLQAQGKLGEAEAYYRATLEGRRRVLGDEHPETLVSINNLGFLLQARGKLPEAEVYLRDALEKFRRVMGEDDPATLVSISNMGALLYALGRLSEAEQYFHETIDLSRRVLGVEHYSTLRAMDNMSVVLRGLGRFAEAEIYCREALEKYRRLYGNEHPDTIIATGNLGVLLHSLGRVSDAEDTLRQALESARSTLGAENPVTLRAVHNLGYLLLSQGRITEADPLIREAWESRRHVLGDAHGDTLLSLVSMGNLLQAQERSAEAVELLSTLEPTARQTFVGGNAPRLGRFLAAVGCARATCGDFDQAEADLIEAYDIIKNANGSTRQDHAEVLACLVRLYDARHAAAPAENYNVQAEHWRGQQREVTSQP